MNSFYRAYINTDLRLLAQILIYNCLIIIHRDRLMWAHIYAGLASYASLWIHYYRHLLPPKIILIIVNQAELWLIDAMGENLNRWNITNVGQPF